MPISTNLRLETSSMLTALAILAMTSIAWSDADVDALERALQFRTLQLQESRADRQSDLVTILVNTGGSEDDAKKYYTRIGPIVNFSSLASSDLDSFITYLGFDGLRAVDVEVLASPTLMPSSQPDFDQLAASVTDPELFKKKRSLADFKDGRVLVSRFFAPKIVDYNQTPNPNVPPQNPHTAGWRKLVRIVPVPGSDADKGGIREAYILFNFFQPDVNRKPFPEKASELNKDTESVNNQIILVPESRKAVTDDSAFWIVYTPNSEGYKLGYFLNAAFDVLDPAKSKQPYFVPMACAQCHGHDLEINTKTPPNPGPFPFAKTNYLDTDQWYDMVEFDFPGTKNPESADDVIYDGGRDHSKPTYMAAVQVISLINEAIRIQNEESLRKNKSDLFKILAVEKWLSLHKVNTDPSPLFDRAINSGKGMGQKSWDEANSLDAALLPKLDHFCFRCHGVVRYDVFDRPKVKGLAGTMSSFIGDGTMPQGRTLTATEKEELQNLLEILAAEE